ncbi:single-stranded DNA-binding protein [Corynebacterium sp. 335C]
MSLSTVTILGNLTAHPTIHDVKDGVSLARFTVASSRNRRVDGEWKSGETTFLEVECWDDMARNVVASLRKGMAVVVHGRLDTSRWEDKEGNPRSKMRLRAIAVGPDLRRAEVAVTRVRRETDAWGDAAPGAGEGSGAAAAPGRSDLPGPAPEAAAYSPSFADAETGVLQRAGESGDAEGADGPNDMTGNTADGGGVALEESAEAPGKEPAVAPF